MKQPSTPNPFEQSHASIEKRQRFYANRLRGILSTPVTVTTIDTFAQDALQRLLEFVDEIVNEYRTSVGEETLAGMSKKAIEDAASQYFGVKVISEVLDVVSKKVEEIEELKKHLQDNLPQTPAVITPPQDMPLPEGEGAQPWEDPKIFPRLLTLLYILEHDFSIPKEEVRLLEGSVMPHMVRQTPYVRAEVDDLNRLIYVCDEEGNASYVFDMQMLEKENITIEMIDLINKDERKDLLKQHPGIGARVIQSKNWRTIVSKLLAEEIPKKFNQEKAESTLPAKRASEFKKKEWLPFDEFHEEVRRVWEEAGRPGDVSGWYASERKKHDNWPSEPNKKYKDTGWKGFPEVVGKENRLKKEFLTFDTFQEEVQRIWEEAGEPDPVFWYADERKKHDNWPSNPWVIYKEDGWDGFPELVGRDNPRKKEQLLFTDFREEVLTAWEEAGKPIGISEWYISEKKNHPNWYSNPWKIYKEDGWEGFPELVGMENPRKKEFLSFDNFQEEVRGAWEEAGRSDRVKDWYKDEKNKHQGWNSQPHVLYKGVGWKGWSELVGEKNLLKKEFLPFDAFQEEVRLAWEEAGRPSNVRKWFRIEQKKRQGWHSNPREFYKDTGWIGFPELVGSENRFKIEYLSFDNFREEVLTAWEEAGRPDRVRDWYTSEKKKHPNWHSSPWKIYKEAGWKGFPELVGK